MPALNTLSSQLDTLFEERDQLFPYRDPENSTAVQTTMTAYIAQLRAKMPATWQPNPALLAQITPIAQHPIIICGYQKSGTSFFARLLDNHPQLVVLPGDSHLLKRIAKQANQPPRFWSDYWAKRFINPSGQHPFWLLGKDHQPYVNFLAHSDYWLTTQPPSAQNFILSTIFAYFCANPNRPAQPQYWVSKTPRNEKEAARFVQLFPQAKFIHIIRNPYHNLASLKRLAKQREKKWRTWHTALSLRHSAWLASKNQRVWGKERYFIIQHETLLAQPTKIMNEVAKFLDITMDDALLQPTVNELPAKANSMYKKDQVVGKINPHIARPWQNEFQKWEQNLLKWLFKTR